jgi:hypothetical protein
MHLQEKLAQRRNELIARCATQRRTITMHGQPLAHTMSTVDTTISIVKHIRQHPGLVVGAVLGIIALRPSRLSRMLHGGTVALRTLRFVAPVVQRFRARHA